MALREKRLRSKVIITAQLPEGLSHQREWKIFSVVPEGKSSKNGLKLQKGTFQLSIRRNILTIRAVKLKYEFPRRFLNCHLKASSKGLLAIF